MWVVTGDGDGLSIGGNHLIHAIRRNVDLKILLFNNRIYGLTKGQYSPTSRAGQEDQVHAAGLGRLPAQPAVARARRRGDLRRPHASTSIQAHLSETLKRAAAHKGTAFVEIYQNCNIFNDGAFETITDKETREDDDALPRARQAADLRQGQGQGHPPRPADAAARGGADSARRRARPDDLPGLGRDAQRTRRSPSCWRSSSRRSSRRRIGVFRAVSRPTYEQRVIGQIQAQLDKKGTGTLEALLYSGEVWRVESDGAIVRQGTGSLE